MAKLTYIKKDLKVCPVCAKKFKEETMFTGGVRQVSEKLTRELRTIYKKFNNQPVVPFIYEVLTCPQCLYSALITDFDSFIPSSLILGITEKHKQKILNLKTNFLKDINKRKKIILDLKDIDFNTNKTLLRALGEYMIAEQTYHYFSEKSHPVVKQAICSIRAAWLAGDLGLDDIKNIYYEKSNKYYNKFTSVTDTTDGIKLGPDWGNNFGFDGARYLASILELKFINNIPTLNDKFESLKKIRSTLSKLRGYGKASKQKVGPLLRLTEEVFEEISPEYDKLKNLVENGVDESKLKPEEKKIIIKDEKQIPCKLENKNSTDESLNLDKYHLTAIDIVKYSVKTGIKKDSLDDLIKILKKHL